jgi:FdhE protein
MLSVRSRINSLEHQHPEWRSWLALYKATLRALDDPAWRALEVRACAEQAPHVPLLDGVRLFVDADAARAWVQHIGEGMAKHQSDGLGSWSVKALKRLDALALLQAAARQDFTRLHMMADSLRVEARAVQAFAHLAVTPLLQECRRRLADRLSAMWTHGYCPLCGAWAVLAELRGLERTRRLRCGRCGGDWRTGWLRCVFCGETRHERLAVLSLEGGDGTQSIETCASCQGYTKTLTTLQGAAPQAVMLEDLATVELDVVALERGYARPHSPGYCVNLSLLERPRAWSSVLRRLL